MFQLLALDMDGTLLNKKKLITTPVKEAIHALTSHHIYVTLASGRFPASVWLHARYLDLNFPLIALNGAVILDHITGSEMASFPISSETLTAFTKLIQDAGSYIQFYGYNVLFVKELNEMNRVWPLANVVMNEDKELTIENYRNQVHLLQVQPVGDLIQFLYVNTHPILKATVIHDDPCVVDRLTNELKKWQGITISRTGLHRFDMNAWQINKKYALERLCKEYQIASEHVVAAGDYDNDREMIEWAGMGVAMGNANEDLKALANHVTDSNEEHGVARIIDRFF
jgi:Cof subfamily protein (haloacid dehalogenase superfamily)